MDDDDLEGWCGEPEMHVTPSYRVSALLGPDGEPLLVGYERPKFGFDLTPTTPDAQGANTDRTQANGD